jgi:hypothetical protein
MSLRLLGAWQVGEATIHTALDDLESFLWLLIWGIVYASKKIPGAMDVNKGIKLMLDAWSGNANSNLAKLAHALGWKDAVFGDLIREWLGIFIRTRVENERFVQNMSSIRPGSKKWVKACKELESYCKDIYGEVLESGFRYLEGISQYPDWDRVVAANSRRYIRKQFDEVEDEMEDEMEDV